MSTPEEWFKSLPPVTRTYFIAALATTLLVQFHVISARLLYLDFELILYKFNFWRLITCFLFFGTFSLPFIFTMIMLIQNFRSAESEYFTGTRGLAEFIHLILIGMLGTYAVSYLWAPMPFPGDVLVYMVLYVWSRKQPMRDTIFYGFKFKAWHFPFVLLALGYLLGASPYQSIVGILIGHVYHFATDLVPLRYNKTVLACPQMLYAIVEKNFGGGASVPARATFRNFGGGHRMGE